MNWSKVTWRAHAGSPGDVLGERIRGRQRAGLVEHQDGVCDELLGDGRDVKFRLGADGRLRVEVGKPSRPLPHHHAPLGDSRRAARDVVTGDQLAQGCLAASRLGVSRLGGRRLGLGAVAAHQ
jgi:hypothetical protein